MQITGVITSISGANMSSVARWQTQNRFTGLTKWLMVFSLFVCIQSTAFAHDGDDKRPLEHEDYDRWNTIGTQSISNDGKWILYSVVNGKDESTLKIRSATSDREYSVAFGTGGRISYDSKYAAYRIQPCLLYTSPSPRDGLLSRMPSSA